MLMINMDTTGLNPKLFSFWIRISPGNLPNQLTSQDAYKVEALAGTQQSPTETVIAGFTNNRQGW
jgi:hypothetical protein